MNRLLPRLILALAFLVLLGAFWATVWHGVDQSVLSRVPILDEAVYLQRAATITDQNWLPSDPFTMSPLYSYLVALTGSGRTLDEFRLRSDGPPRGIRWLQALLWFGTAWILWRVGRDLFGLRWAWGAPLLWLGYGPAAILATQVLMEIPLAFVATLALAVSGGHVGPASHRGRALLSGALVGAAFLFRGTAIVLLVPVVLALVPDRSSRSWRAVALPVLATLILVVLPFTVFNSVRAGRPVPPALNGGVNLYLGNGPGASGFFRVIPGYDLEKDPSGTEYLSRAFGQTIPDTWTANRIWTAEARAAMLTDPVRVLGLWAQKIRLHLVGIEIPQISAFSAWPRQAPILRGLFVPWAFLAGAGLAGGVLAWRRYKALRPWLVALVLLIVVQSLFFVVTRYRIILVPGLVLAAVALARDLVSRRGRDLALGLVVVVLAVVAIWPWGLAGVSLNLAVGGLDNEAIRWEHMASSQARSDAALADGYLVEAETLYRRSIDLADHRFEPWQGLGRVLWSRDRHAEASAILADGVNRVRAPEALRRDLIAMLMRQQRSSDALPYLEEALAQAPGDADLLHHAAVAMAENGRSEDAEIVAGRLIATHPADPRGYFDLGVMLMRQDRLQEAGDVFSEGLRHAPNHTELLRNLAWVRELLAEQP